MSQILLVLAEPEHPGALPGWVQLIPVGPTAAWPSTVSTLCYSVASVAETPQHRVADPAGVPSNESSIPLTHGWDLLPRLRGASLVHICRPYTRAGEIALLAARLLGKRTVLSDFGRATSVIGASFGITDLADCLICQSEAEAERYSNHPRVAILDLSSLESWPTLSNIYTDLLGCEARLA
jgi:hypothetical protein